MPGALDMLLFLVTLLASALFSGLETGITTASAFKIQAEANKGEGRYRLLERLLANREYLVSMCVIGNNITIIAMTLILAGLATTTEGKLILVVAETVFIVIFAEIIPKALFHRFPEKLLYLMAYPLRVIQLLLFPLSWPVTRVSLWFIRLLGDHNQGDITRSDVLRLSLLMRGDVEVSSEGGDSIQGVLDLRESHAADVMTPRHEIRMLPENSTLAELVEFASQVRYTKIPLYHDNPDNITGYVNINDLLKARKNQSIVKFKKPAIFIPETKSLLSLIQMIKEDQDGIFFVVNEFNILVGLISKEDVVEEVVGDVYSRERSEREPVRRRKNGTWEIDCKISLDDLNERLDLSIESETERTLAGWLIERFGQFPVSGSSLHEHLKAEYLKEHPDADEAELHEHLQGIPDFVVKKRTNRAILTASLYTGSDALPAAENGRH